MRTKEERFCKGFATYVRNEKRKAMGIREIINGAHWLSGPLRLDAACALLEESGKLNAKAAGLTEIAALLTALAVLFGAL